MSNILIHYRDNYADEFDIFGFCLMPEESWNRIKDKLTIDDIRYFRFGSNEEIYYNSKDEFLTKFWHRPVSDIEAKTLKKMFRGISTGFGHWPLENMELELPNVIVEEDI